MKYQPKTSKHLTSILVAATLAMAAGTSIAEGPRAKRMFERADTNGDGYISLEEFQLPGRREHPADIDGDGQLTRAEMTEHATTRSEEMLTRATERFTSMDLNGDDVVTADEARQSMFSHMDKDGDGLLSKDELKRPKRRPGGPHEG